MYRLTWLRSAVGKARITCALVSTVVHGAWTWSIWERPNFSRELLRLRLLSVPRSHWASAAAEKAVNNPTGYGAGSLISRSHSKSGGTRTDHSLPAYVADGAFIARHIDPDTTDLRATFDLLRRALTALARESAASAR